MESHPKKGRFTFRTAAVFFVLSAVFEILSITAEAPLFGEIRSGMSAGIYHSIYIVLFLGLGVGLWSAKKWGYTLLFVTIGLYTLDQLQFLLSQQVRDAYTAQLQGALVMLMPGISQDFITSMLVLIVIIFILCWWGFALYAYWRRDYFKNGEN